MGNLFAELKRRHIYRVAAAYAVVAWVLLQLVNNLAPALRIPDWGISLVVVLLVVGFPIVLIFAWVHELGSASVGGTTTNATTNKLDWALMGALVVVIALVSYQQLAPTNGAKTVQQTSVTPTSTQPGVISIAVLPFANISADQEQEFFSDGMTDEITSALVKVPNLHVVGRSSAFQFKGQNRDIQAIGQALHASHVIEGSVRKAGNRVRIAAQLIQADNGLQVWTDNYDRELTDVFAIQENIAEAIATALRAPLGLEHGETLVRNRTKDDATYLDFLRAKGLVLARGYDRYTEAIKLLEQVVARDPDFAPAWAQLASAYASLPYSHPAYFSGEFDQLGPIVKTWWSKVETAARRAIQLDPKSTEGLLALGGLQAGQEKYSVAADLYSRALALDPDNPQALFINSVVLADQGYTRQAFAMVQRLLALEPFVPGYNVWAATVMWLNGQTDAAIAILKPLAAGGTGLSTPATALARIYAAQGRYNEAADLLQSIPAGIYLPGTVEAAVRLMRSAPAAASPQTLPRLGSLSWVYFYVGAADHVLDYRETAEKSGIWIPIYYYWAQPYESLRKTERFKALMRTPGYVDYWRARGWPDLCHPTTGDDFVCD